MKNFRLVKKLLTLSILVLCLGWALMNENNVKAMYCCDDCHDEYGACVTECGSGNAPCLNDCRIMRNHCILFCDISDC